MRDLEATRGRLLRAGLATSLTLAALGTTAGPVFAKSAQHTHAPRHATHHETHHATRILSDGSCVGYVGVRWK